jgi:hypothetical protein
VVRGKRETRGPHRRRGGQRHQQPGVSGLPGAAAPAVPHPREKPHGPAFRSVILAGVTDVKHLKAKIRPGEASKVNNPWNIAANFDVDMSFSADDVVGMLAQYEADHLPGMDVAAVAEEVVAWTGGYPFLVSRVCQLVDKHCLSWDHAGVDAAVRLLLKDDDVSLFESLTGKLEDYPALKE